MSYDEQHRNISNYKEEHRLSHNNDNFITTEMTIQSKGTLLDHEQNEDKMHSTSTKNMIGNPQEDSIKDSQILSNSASKIINRRGNTYMYWFNKEELPRICIGPQWYVPILLIIFILIMASLFFVTLWKILHPYVIFAGFTIGFIQMGSYLLTYLLNPGLPSRNLWLENFNNDKSKLKNYRLCEICKLYMNLDKRTEHCPDCNICIEGMNHHCPWTSKCVARGNVVWFYLFITFTYIYILYFVFALLSIIVLHARNKK